MIKVYLFLIIMGVLSAAGYGAYYYYTDTQERIATLTKNNAKLEISVQISEQATKQLQADYKKVGEELNKVNQEFTNIRAQNNVLVKKLARHDLAVIGSAKPGPVQRIINKATVKVGRCFEILSGAKLNVKEREAKNGKQFNSECPWLWVGSASS